MKKLAALAFIAMLFITARAQEVKFGIKTGLNLSHITTTTHNTPDEDPSTIDPAGQLFSMHLGGYINWELNDYFGLQPEVLFSMQGEREEDILLKFNYINTPLLLTFSPLSNFSMMAGPQIGFNVYRGMAMMAGDDIISGSDMDEALAASGMKANTVDLSAALGIQYLAAGHLLLGARYTVGLTPIFSATEEGASISGGRNMVLQVSVGYQF